jgi:radical SAM superfamily enzyme YgiQ (UPF0313 family)
MKILLIYPARDARSPVRSQFDFRHVYEMIFWPLPIAAHGYMPNVLETLASLTPPGVEVTILDENRASINFDAKVDLVALSVMVTHATRAYEIADQFRRRGVPVIMGGYHPFHMSGHHMEDEVFEHVDSICPTEADDLWPQIVEDARRGALQRVYRQEQYTDMSTVRHRITSPTRQWFRFGAMSIQASRGCPFHCDFCSIISMLGNKMRYKSPETLVAELEHVYHQDSTGYVVGRRIHLVDDNVYGVPKEFRRLLRAIIELNARHPRFKPYYASQLTINVSKDRETLALMREAGFDTIYVGLESLDPAVLRAYDKRHNLAFDYDQAVQTLREFGLEMVASFIFGQDMDTPAVFDQVFDFFDRNDIVHPYFNILVPNNKQFDRLRAEGRILSTDWRLFDGQHTIFVPMKMRPRELQQGFVDLISRVFEYPNIEKRLRSAFVRHGSRQMMLPYPLQLLLYGKVLAMLALTGDREGYRFVRRLGPLILKNKLSMLSVIYQVDQHDFAVKNRHSSGRSPTTWTCRRGKSAERASRPPGGACPS